MPKSKRIPVALTVAGSDPSGGAGVQADLKTFAALGVYGSSAITALTVQDTRGVHAVHPVEPDVVAAQVRAVLADLAPAAAKVGMLANAAVAGAVADALAGFAPLVVDPVARSSSGRELLDAAGLEVLRARLLPAAALITPNADEAAALLGRSVDEVRADPAAACRDLLALGPRAVLLTGGDAPGDTCVDHYCDGLSLEELPAPRVPTRHTHGTGCTLSAAITAYLARGEHQNRAVRAAKRYVLAALRAADDLDVGHGRGPLHHFHRRTDPQ